LIETTCVLAETSDPIASFILESKTFLKIVAFRFDNKDFADLLLSKARTGVNIEIVTTPSDNVAKESLRPIVEVMYEQLQKSNVKMYFCSWEAGEPELTPTSVSGKQSASASIGEKWYSLHLQLFINENGVMVTSRPLTADKTLDIFFRTTDQKLKEQALSKFEEIKKLFISPTTIEGLQLPGSVFDFLDEKMKQETLTMFSTTRRLNVREYYRRKLPNAVLNEGLFISPFDGQMRDFLYEFIDSASEYVYFFLETFFDEALMAKLQEKRAKSPDCKIKILCRPPHMIRQNRHTALGLVTQGLSSGIEFSNRKDIQGKFWVSDKWFALSSGDFNKMNLGIMTSAERLKADTQLLLLSNDKNLIHSMKEKFETCFAPMDIGTLCSRDAKLALTRVLKGNHLHGSSIACTYLSRFKSSLLVRTENDVNYVLETAVRLALADSKRGLEGEYMLMAIIIYNVQRREHRLDEIIEKLEAIEDKQIIERTVKRMEQKGQLLKSGEVFRIAPNIEGSNVQKKIGEF
jgi:hypothetical protein